MCCGVETFKMARCPLWPTTERLISQATNELAYHCATEKLPQRFDPGFSEATVRFGAQEM